MTEEVAQERLVILPWSEGKIDVAILMIWYRNRWISPTMKAFMELTKEVMAQAFREGNPATGEEIKIPVKTVAEMKIAKAAKEAIVPGRKK